MKNIYGTFGVEMRAYGQKLVKFCKHTDASKLVVEIIVLLISNRSNLSTLTGRNLRDVWSTDMFDHYVNAYLNT